MKYLSLFIVFFLFSCTPSIKTVESEVLADIKKDMKSNDKFKKNYGMVTDITLKHLKDDKYEGTLYSKQDGKKYSHDVSVTYTTSKFEWKIKFDKELKKNTVKNNNTKVTFLEAKKFMINRCSNINQKLIKSHQSKFNNTSLYMFFTTSTEHPNQSCVTSISENKLEILASDCKNTSVKISQWNQIPDSPKINSYDLTNANNNSIDYNNPSSNDAVASINPPPVQPKQNNNYRPSTSPDYSSSKPKNSPKKTIKPSRPSPQKRVEDWLNSLQNKGMTFRQGHDIVKYIPRSNYSNYSSYKNGFGSISSVDILSTTLKDENSSKAVVVVEYNAYDPQNSNLNLIQRMDLQLKGNRWYIVEIKVVKAIKI
ncbi:MAG: hypothetical protein P8I93_09730 [Crocinitomicaceae bacterium]|nr:hypothetical protein [Crocinitomicaceae bacterium]